MSKPLVKRAINKAAWALSMANESRVRSVLTQMCQTLQQDGKTPDEVETFLKRLVTDGVTGFDGVMGFDDTQPIRTGAS